MLDASQRRAWARDGWMVLPGLLDPARIRQIERWLADVEGWSVGGGPGLHHFEQTDPSGPGDDGVRLARSEDFDPHHSGLSGFMRDGMIVEVLAELFDQPAVLFKEKINYKHPGGAGFAPHQDASAYRFVDHHISVMVPIDPSTIESGCLYFAPGHSDGLIDHELGRLDPAWVAHAAWEPIEVAPGDVVFFDSYAPHYSDTNRSERSRRAMYLTYNAAVHGDVRARYYRDKRRLLEATAGSSDRARISVNDDFLGRAVTPTSPR